MDASLRNEAEKFAAQIAGQASSVEDLNSLMKLMMKSAMERMLDSEMDVHLGRVPQSVADPSVDGMVTSPGTHQPKSGPKKGAAATVATDDHRRESNATWARFPFKHLATETARSSPN